MSNVLGMGNLIIMSKHQHDHFIPSPYPVVTAYENEFIKKYNNTMSAAVSEVLKYMAKVTAAEIKGNEK